MPPKIKPCTHNGPDWPIFRGLQSTVIKQINNNEDLSITLVILFTIFTLWNMGLTIDAYARKEHKEQVDASIQQVRNDLNFRIIERATPMEAELDNVKSNINGLFNYLDVERIEECTDKVTKIDHSKKKPEPFILCCQ